ncbi:MAG TPA: hypothetical protein VKB88_46020 [Bryobacteraceae bacterium]|nr:hypothetical protein [Bryobacteraceae bacterium]
MRMRAVFGLGWMCLLPLAAAVPAPDAWVPVRWPWAEARSLDLLESSPVNCLLLKSWTPELIAAAQKRGVVPLAVIAPGSDAVATAKQALSASVGGLVLEGDFADETTTAIRQAAGSAVVIELTARNRMALGSAAPILGTYQGLWPGISDEHANAHSAGPSGSTWIDTNTGFLRAARVWGTSTVWIANQPPAHTVITTSRYLQAIADAAMSGARWVLALDTDFSSRLAQRDADAVASWRRISALLSYYESHPEWRALREYGKLAVIQDPAKGGLVSGGILDMIAVKHTPVIPVPRQRLGPGALDGATMAVNIDADSLTPEQKEILRNFTRSGGALLTGPPGWKDSTPPGERITLDKAELDRLNDIWRDVNSMIGRRNLGVRLFNVSSMLSNVMASADEKTEIVQLVNYSDYPVENVTVHFLGSYKRATLLTPEGAEKKLDIYSTEEGSGVDIDKVGVCATIRLEP